MEDAPGVAPAGEHVDLIGDARAGRVDQIEERHAEPARRLLDAHDLLDGARAPRAGLDRRVVGHDGDGAAVDLAEAGDDAVGGQVGRAVVGEQAVLDEVARVVVEEQAQALAREQLALLLRSWRGTSRRRRA